MLYLLLLGDSVLFGGKVTFMLMGRTGSVGELVNCVLHKTRMALLVHCLLVKMAIRNWGLCRRVGRSYLFPTT